MSNDFFKLYDFDLNDPIVQEQIKQIAYSHSRYDSLIAILFILWLIGTIVAITFGLYKGIKLLLSKNTQSL